MRKIILITSINNSQFSYFLNIIILTYYIICFFLKYYKSLIRDKIAMVV